MADPTKDDVKAKEDAEKAAAEKPTKPADGSDRAPSRAAIAKAIEGLSFRTNKAIPVRDDSTGKPIVEGGKEKVRYVPDERAMTMDDVLSTRYDEGVLILVSKDGSKHRLGKGK